MLFNFQYLEVGPPSLLSFCPGLDAVVAPVSGLLGTGGGGLLLCGLVGSGLLLAFEVGLVG